VKLPLAASMLLLAGSAAAGSVTDREEGSTYRVVATTGPDLSDPAGFSGEADVEADGSFDLDGEWLWLRQDVGTDDGPMVFWLPIDRADEPSIAGLPGRLARLQQGGEQPAGWWRPAALMTVLLLLGAPLGWWLLGRRRHEAGPAWNPDGVPEARWERPAVGVVVAMAAALRLPRMLAEPLELLEHTYGPGLPGVRELGTGDSLWSLLGQLPDPEAGRALVEAILAPPSLIVTHPPLYHWLLTAIGHGTNWSEAALRAPALVASLATVVMLWRLGRRAGPVAGVAAAGAFAVSAPAAFWGGDASPYALVGAVHVGSLLLLLRALADGRKRWFAAWLGCLAVGFLSHYTTAIFGVLQGVVLVGWLVHRRDDPRWIGAARSALAVLPAVGLLPVLWTWPHFATFEVIGLDTRLMAEAFPRDPGALVYATQLLAVLASVPPSTAWGGLPLLGLAGVGLLELRRRDPVLASLLGAGLLAGLLGVFFFYSNAVSILQGRVFWGFRWVSWGVPAAALLGGCGLARRGWGTAALAGSWLILAGAMHVRADAQTTRPDYERAAAVIDAELQGRDGVAVLPLWGQRGSLQWYLAQMRGWDLRGPQHAIPAYLNPTHESLPVASSAWNGHVDRLWLAVVDERMFGRGKFQQEQARADVAWAREHLIPDGTWTFDHLTLHRFVRPAAEWTGELVITHPQVDPQGLRFQEPNLTWCGQVSELLDLPAQDPANAEGVWRLELRVPVPRGTELTVEVENGELTPLPDPDAWAARVIGGDCRGPAPVVRLRR